MINRDHDMDIDTLMERLRVETEKYRIVQSGASDHRGPSSQPVQLPNNPPAQRTRPPRVTDVPDVPDAPAGIQLVLPDPREHDERPPFQPATDGNYNVRGLTSHQDRDFIHAAYWAILGRAADEEGLGVYLRLLRSGVSKLEILEFLRQSQEGQKRSARVAGLRIQLIILKVSRLPIVGQFVNYLAALWNLPAHLRTQRAMQGDVISLIEQAQINSRRSLLTINRALSDLSYGYRQLAKYAESKLDRNSSKASNEAIRRWLDEVRDSLETLRATKAATDEVTSIKSALQAKVGRDELSELSARSRELVRTDNKASLDAALSGVTEKLAALAQSKVDHSVLEAARAEAKTSLDNALGQLNQKVLSVFEKKADRVALEVAVEEGRAALAGFGESKADKASLADVHQSLIRALATKAERHELTQLTNHLVSLLETRLTRKEITSLEESVKLLTSQSEFNRAAVEELFGELRVSLKDVRNETQSNLEASLDSVRATFAALIQAKVDYSALEAARAEAKVSLDTALSQLNLALQSVSESKADRTALEAVAGENRSSIDLVRNDNKASIEAALNRATETFAALAQTKVDHSVLAAATAEAKASLDNAVEQLNQTLVSVLESKADRAALEAMAGETRNSIDLLLNGNKASLEAALDGARETFAALTQTKVDHNVFEAARAESKASLENAVDRLNQTLLSFSESKADRAALEAAVGQNRDLLELMRNDNKANLEAALDNVRKTFAALIQTKVDHGALEAARESAKASLDSAVNQLNQALLSVSERKADRAALEAVAGESRNSLELLRNDNKASLDTALDNVRATFAALTQTKVDHSTFEAARESAKASLDNAMGQLNQALLSISESKADRTALEAAVGESRKSIEATHRESQEALFRALTPVTTETRDIKRNLLDQERRLGLFLEETRKRLPKPISSVQLKNILAEEDHVLDAMYASFEDVFRGTREDIKQRQSIYLPYVQRLKATLNDSPVVDIGCGRGEWLEILRDEGFQSQGVDLNRVFLDGCRELKLDVVERDAVTYLREQAPNSLGIVTSFHVIEHLSHKTLITFLDAAFRALKPEGLLILETPNPKNFQVGSCNFYLDPTHRNPLPPDLMRYLLEARGFVQIETKELHPFSPEDQITDGAPAVVNTLNRFFFSAQDYAMIGKKL